MADTSIKLSGTYDSIEAYRILEEMRDMSEDYEGIKTEAEAAASAATAASTAATNAVNAANTAVSNAQTYAGNANTSASDAAGYASNASTSATNAATSETNASNSASAAATSESNAATSETNASDSATAAAASAAEVEAALDDYLPLSGGTLTGDVLGVTPPNGDNSKKLANTEFIQALASILVPTGCVQAFAGSSTPSGWLFCDGSAVSRITYADLFSVIGTTYGAGDGTDTFNLPNLTDKFIQGNATSGTEHSAGLPNITGKIGAVINTGATSAFYPTAPSDTLPPGSYMGTMNVEMDASRSNPIYGNSATVQPPSVTMRYIIKY